MERLTTQWIDGTYDTFNPIDIQDNDYSKINYEKVLAKLGEYEDLEEQGLLIKLPCKVGDVVWFVDKYEREVERTTVEKIVVKAGGIYIKLSCNAMYETSCKSIGKTVFFTEAEAEQAMERRKKNV